MEYPERKAKLKSAVIAAFKKRGIEVDDEIEFLRHGKSIYEELVTTGLLTPEDTFSRFRRSYLEQSLESRLRGIFG